MSIRNIITIIWCVVLCTITSLLMAEYLFFKERNEQLNALKDDYATYVQAFKKLIIEYNSLKETNSEFAETSDQKKKSKQISQYGSL